MEARANRLLISPLGLTPGVITGGFLALEAAGYGPIDKVITFGTGEGAMSACENMVGETLRAIRPGEVYETRRPTTKRYLDQLADVDRFRKEVQKTIAAHVADGYHVLLNLTGGRRSMTAALLLGAHYFIMDETARVPGGEEARDKTSTLSVFHLEVIDAELEGEGHVAMLLQLTPEERRPYLRPAAGAIQPVDISILLPERGPVAQWSKLFEYAVGQFLQTQAGWRPRYNFFPAHLRGKDLGEVDVYAESDDGRVLLTECKLRTGDDPADKPVTRGEVQRLLNKRAAVEQATGRPAEARLFSKAPYAEKGALELAAAGGATIWCVSLPDNWRRRADWTFGDVRPAMIAPWDVAQGDETDG